MCAHAGCGRQLQARHAARHAALCAKRLIGCPRRGCGARVAAETLERHVALECQTLLATRAPDDLNMYARRRSCAGDGGADEGEGDDGAQRSGRGGAPLSVSSHVISSWDFWESDPTPEVTRYLL